MNGPDAGVGYVITKTESDAEVTEQKDTKRDYENRGNEGSGLYRGVVGEYE